MAEPGGPAASRPGQAGRSTLAVHGGATRGTAGDPVAAPIYQSTTFAADPTGRGEVLYTRYGNNPGHRRLEAKIAALENAEACLVTGSGMAAMSAALFSRLEPGDHVLAAEAIYGGTRLLLDGQFTRLGVDVSYADFQATGWTERIRPSTRVLLAELPANPLMRVPDPEALVGAASAAGAIVILDVTFATPMNFRGLEHGVDLIVHSATKYLGGHSDVTAGAVCGSVANIAAVRERAASLGTAPDPHAAWLVERGVKTLALRMERHNANGLAVARWLSDRPEVARVYYPGLPSHPDYAVARRVLSGFGGMVGVELRGGGDAANRFVRALRLAINAPSLGGVETLVSQPRFTSHVRMPPEHRERVGIRDGFVRFSLGIEDADDLIADLEQALRATHGSARDGAVFADPMVRQDGQ